MRLATPYVPLVLFAFVLSGCATLSGGPAPSAPPVVVEPAAEVPLEIRWARRSAEHDAAFVQTYRAAGRHLRAVVDTLSTAEWAVVLDADETLLDNSLYQRERAEQGLGYTSESWNEWVRREAASALPGAVAFTRLVNELNGRVVVVTNRADAVCDETRRNLERVGVAAAAVLCQVGEEGDKNPRFAAVEGGGVEGLPPLSVVMWMGDNIQDFPGLTQDVRREGEAALSAFGQRFWVLPNPMYGSWTRNGPAEMRLNRPRPRSAGTTGPSGGLWRAGGETLPAGTKGCRATFGPSPTNPGTALRSYFWIGLLSLLASGASAQSRSFSEDSVRAVVEHVAVAVITPTYGAVAHEALGLKAATEQLAEAPSAATLSAAREAWLQTREHWEQAEAFIFGPVDIGVYDPLLDSWPLNVIDLDAVLASGLDLSPDSIEGFMGSIRGFHAMEYLLWGASGARTPDSLSVRDLAYLNAVAGDVAISASRTP